MHERGLSEQSMLSFGLADRLRRAHTSPYLESGLTVLGAGGFCRLNQNVSQLGTLYIENSCLTWEGQQFHGKTAILAKLSGLPFTKITHILTAQDHQPTIDSCILSMVVGQLKADDDAVIGFHQVFLLKNINDAWPTENRSAGTRTHLQKEIHVALCRIAAAAEKLELNPRCPALSWESSIAFEDAGGLLLGHDTQ
ncbi:hypothetical protein GJAV_G00064100 [Gymnothorax javanicus]|nr:hypothetical protein GJAV_G00064100 [Gymnothorax javanicus]